MLLNLYLIAKPLCLKTSYCICTVCTNYKKKLDIPSPYVYNAPMRPKEWLECIIVFQKGSWFNIYQKDCPDSKKEIQGLLQTNKDMVGDHKRLQILLKYI